MGLDAVFQNAARTAFGVFKDVVTSVRYETVATTTYDASSGVVSAHGFAGIVSVIFSKYRRQQVDGDRIKPQDVKVLVLPDQLPAVPRADDKFHVVEANCSVTYRILDSSVDPATALYIMQARKISG